MRICIETASDGKIELENKYSYKSLSYAKTSAKFEVENAFYLLIYNILSSASEGELKAKRDFIFTYANKQDKPRMLTLLKTIASELKSRYNPTTNWFINEEEVRKLRDLYYYVYKNTDISRKEARSVPGFEYVEL